MVRIGIIGSDKWLLAVIQKIKFLNRIEITGCYCDDPDSVKEFSICSGILFYPTPEALFRYVDAVVLNYNMAGNIPLIAKCLKNFKHVFAIDVHGIRYKDFEYLEKIAEESNVKFYPEFGEPAFKIPENILGNLFGFHYLNIHHSLGCLPGITGEKKLFTALLQVLGFVMNLTRANVKRINANGWNLSDPGSGILNARLDFDNDSFVNILITSELASKQVLITSYSKSLKTDINFNNETGQASTIPFGEGMHANTTFTVSSCEAILEKIFLFVSSLDQTTDGLKALENQFKSIRINQIIREKINSSSKNILYS